jgi:hypothetical protein
MISVQYQHSIKKYNCILKHLKNYELYKTDFKYKKVSNEFWSVLLILEQRLVFHAVVASFLLYNIL